MAIIRLQSTSVVSRPTLRHAVHSSFALGTRRLVPYLASFRDVGGSYGPVSVFLTGGSNTAMNMLSKPVESCRKTSSSLNLSLVLILSECALQAT